MPKFEIAVKKLAQLLFSSHVKHAMEKESYDQCLRYCYISEKKVSVKQIGIVLNQWPLT